VKKLKVKKALKGKKGLRRVKTRHQLRKNKSLSP